MKIFLINPPGSSPFSPPLGILSIASYLRSENVEVKIHDTSINALHYILKPSRMQRRIEHSRQILQTKVNIFPPAIVDQLKVIEKKIDMLLNVLTETWREDGFSMRSSDFGSTIAALNRLTVFASLSYLPTIFGICTYHGNMGMVTTPQQDPFADYYMHELIPEIEKFGPDMVGVSLSFEMQFHFACSIVNLIRQKQIVPIVAGGSYFSTICDQLFKGASAEVSADSTLARRLLMVAKPYGVCGEGEETISSLCHNLFSMPMKEIPGLLYYDEHRNILKFNQKGGIIATEKLPIITLDDVPISKKYLSPLRIAPLLSSRGCYWNKCTFCDHASVLDAQWREFDLQKVLSNLTLYKKVYGIDFVFFCDESMSPRFLRELSKAILEQELQVKFGTMVRFEKNLEKELSLAAKAGCTFLSFGLESGSPRVIKKMKKGYNHNNAQHILDECARCGIMVETHTMFGFPTESVEEAQQTISFLEKNEDRIAIIRTNPWLMSPQSEIYKNHKVYGIDLNHREYQFMNPRSYTIKEGINYDEAMDFVKKLQDHPVLGKKVIKYDLFNGYPEDYYIVLKACEQSSDRKKDLKTKQNTVAMT